MSSRALRASLPIALALAALAGLAAPAPARAQAYSGKAAWACNIFGMVDQIFIYDSLFAYTLDGRNPSTDAATYCDQELLHRIAAACNFSYRGWGDLEIFAGWEMSNDSANISKFFFTNCKHLPSRYSAAPNHSVCDAGILPMNNIKFYDANRGAWLAPSLAPTTPPPGYLAAAAGSPGNASTGAQRLARIPAPMPNPGPLNAANAEALSIRKQADLRRLAPLLR